MAGASGTTTHLGEGKESENTMNASGLEEVAEAGIHPDAPIDVDENEVQEIIKSIKEAQYFDASSMAPLSPASVVSVLAYIYLS